MNSCPRCLDRSFEILRTHSHCYSCNYTPDISAAELHRQDDDLPIPKWVMDFLSEPESSVGENRRAKKLVCK